MLLLGFVAIGFVVIGSRFVFQIVFFGVCMFLPIFVFCNRLFLGVKVFIPQHYELYRDRSLRAFL